MKRPLVALLLNSLVLPGLGQLYLGRKRQGILLIVAVNLLLVVALFLVMKIAAPLVGVQLAGGQVTPAMIAAQLQPYLLWTRLLMAAFIALWGYGLLDLLPTLRPPRSNSF